MAQGGGFKATIEAVKLGLQTLVYAALLALIVSLFVRPDITAGRLGAFFKAFQDNNINIRIAALGINISPREVQELTDQSTVLDEVKLAGGCLAANECSGQEQARLAEILQIEQVEEYLARSTWEEPVILGSPQTGAEPPAVLVPNSAPVLTPNWVVVLGADRSLAAARDEQDKIAARTDVAQLDLVLRDGWYRTVAFFDTAAQAEAALPELEQAARRKGIYARATAIWCTGSVEMNSDGVVECG